MNQTAPVPDVVGLTIIDRRADRAERERWKRIAERNAEGAKR